MLPGVGIFGEGKLVDLLVPLLRENGFHIEGIWSLNENKAIEASERLSIPFHTNSIDTLLLRKEIHLIIICCSAHLHPQIVSKSFSLGKHVLCNWPIALNVDEIKRMLNSAQYYPSLISILFNPLRFLRTFQLMRTLIVSENYIGNINLIMVKICGKHLHEYENCKYNSNCDQYMGGGLLTNIGSHFIDIITFVTNLKAKNVHGLLRTLSPYFPKINSNCNHNHCANIHNHLHHHQQQHHDLINGKCNSHDHLQHTQHNHLSNNDIRRVTVDDFCTFQLEMENNNHRQPSPLAMVTINDYLPTSFNYEMSVHGDKGYLVIRDENLFGCKHEQTVDEEFSTEELLLNDDGDEEEDDDSSVELETGKIHQQNGQQKSNHSQSSISSTSSTIPKPFTQGIKRLIDALKDAFISCADSPLKKSSNNSNADADLVDKWFKDAVNVAANFEDGEYIQSIVDAIKLSSKNREWIRVQNVRSKPINVIK